MTELDISFGSGFYLASYFCLGSYFYWDFSLDLMDEVYFSLVFSSFLIFFLISTLISFFFPVAASTYTPLIFSPS